MHVSLPEDKSGRRTGSSHWSCQLQFISVFKAMHQRSHQNQICQLKLPAASTSIIMQRAAAFTEYFLDVRHFPFTKKKKVLTSYFKDEESESWRG